MRFYELTESTLTKLVGPENQGQNLAKYLHRVHKVNNDAKWNRIPLDYLTDEPDAHTSQLDDIILIKGTRGWAAIKRTYEQGYTSGKLWEYYLSLYEGPADIDQERDAMEKTRDLKYGRVGVDSRTGKEKIRKNRIYTVPHVDRGQHMVKKRTNTFNKVIDDLKVQLGRFEMAWVSYELGGGLSQIQDVERRRRAIARSWIDRQVDKIEEPPGLNKTKSVWTAHTPTALKQYYDISQNIPGVMSGRGGKSLNTVASIDRNKLDWRNNPDRVQDINVLRGFSSNYSDDARDIAYKTIDLYKLVLRRARIRADRLDLTYSLGNIEREIAELEGERPNNALVTWVDIIDKALERLSKGKSKKSQDMLELLKTNPNDIQAKKYLMSIGFKDLIGDE